MKNHIDFSFPIIWEDATVALYRANRGTYANNYTRGPHYWNIVLRQNFTLHPVVHKIIYRECVRPVDWQLLLLEWPHVSTDNETMIAYTRNEAAGQHFMENLTSDRQTKTTIGKYLSRHWPHVPDHIRRDWAGTFAPAKYEIWDTKEKIIAGIELGPRSCMKSSYGSIPFRACDNEELQAWYAGDTQRRVRWDRHPYAVYDPKYGWRMAVRLDEGNPNVVMARALVNVVDEDNKHFVRSYRRGETESDYSNTDEKLEAWLKTQGFKKRSSWESGLRLRKIDHPNGGPMMPYIDGDDKGVVEHDTYMEIDCDGPDCDNTDGTYDGRETIGECDRCGDTVYEDDEDHVHIGPRDDEMYCGCCARNYTMYVHGSYRGRDTEYYVDCDQTSTQYVSGIGEIDCDNPPSTVVCCEDGDWRDIDACVLCADEEYRPADECVKCEDGEYRPESECWQSATGKWYSDEEDSVDVDSGTYHPDELREMADNA